MKNLVTLTVGEKDFHIDYDALKYDLQYELYIEDPEAWRDTAAKSKDPDIRELVAEDTTDAEFLDKMLRDELYDWSNVRVIDRIISNPNFVLQDDLREKFINSSDSSLRKIAIIQKDNTLEFLNKVLDQELNGPSDNYVINAILNHPNFKLSPEMKTDFFNSTDMEKRKIVAKDKNNTSIELKHMLWNEAKCHYKKGVINAIINNPNYVDDEDSKLLVSWINASLHEKAVKLANNGCVTSEFLNKMLIEELINDKNISVINSIINHPKFAFDEKTSDFLSNAGYKIVHCVKLEKK